LKTATVLIVTSAGEIRVTVDLVRAPITSKNFLDYVSRGAYAGGSFFRTVTTHPDNQPGKSAAVKIDVIQAGPVKGFKEHRPIAFEPTSLTKIRHVDGAISMARSDDQVSATTEFFICIGNQPSLDDGGGRSRDHRGFAAFGRVTHGMDVVRTIHAGHAEGQTLEPPFAILTAAIVHTE
jgi:peptidyl-prolyl cis-trans isomerase A (cyclophilin A)